MTRGKDGINQDIFTGFINIYDPMKPRKSCCHDPGQLHRHALQHVTSEV